MGSNPRSNLSQTQIIQKVYDEDNDRLRVDAQYSASLDGDLEVAIDSANDSVAIGDVGGNKATTTSVSSKRGLDVNVLNSSGAFSPPEDCDAITTDYPDSVTEIYEFREGGASGTILKTVTITYSDATKTLIETVIRT